MEVAVNVHAARTTTSEAKKPSVIMVPEPKLTTPEKNPPYRALGMIAKNVSQVLNKHQLETNIEIKAHLSCHGRF